MRVRAIALAAALARAVGVAGPGSVMVSLGRDGKVANIEARQQYAPDALRELSPVSVSEEPRP